MLELFRYLEQSFVTSAKKTDPINVEGDSEFQEQIRAERNPPSAAEKIRRAAEGFINRHFSPSAEPPAQLQEQLLRFHHELLQLKKADIPVTGEKATKNLCQLLFSRRRSSRNSYKPTLKEHINTRVLDIFGRTAQQLVQTESFLHDKNFLNDILVAVKLITGFDKVNGPELVAMRQAIAFIEQIADYGAPEITAENIRSRLLRPIKVPLSLFPPKAQRQPDSDSPDDQEDGKLEASIKEAQALETTYETLMSLHADELEMISLEEEKPPGPRATKPAVPMAADPINELAAISSRSILTLSKASVNKLSKEVKQTLQKADIDISTTALPNMIAKVKDRWVSISRELGPNLLPSPVTVYQLGIHTFAVRPMLKLRREAALPVPDFSHAVTRPVGVGNLQVVRQELIGYEPGEISHIENILEGELYRRSIRRTESTEITVTEEKETVQMEERDLQSTDRNEMATEAQKESGKQTAASEGQVNTTEYGKLVENSKTNHARSVTDRAVNSLTQRVKEQRVKREQRSYSEKTVHEFDNRNGQSKVRGIYQWVDKKYKTRIMNYGSRLLYDVVIPEPAAFLIESLKNAPQPEGLKLIKPDVFDLFPSSLYAFNYSRLAAKYGVTGSVIPPPDDFTFVPSIDSSMNALKPGDAYFKHFTIEIPDGYKAIRCYVRMVLPDDFEAAQPYFDFIIGEGPEVWRFWKKAEAKGESDPATMIVSFPMKNETGLIPVIFRSYDKISHYSYAIGIYCQRTDKHLEVWQLKTHAAIMNGYNRQLAEYQDKLSKFQAIVRAQMAQAANYAHNPSIEKNELKKAFIYLLLGEHFGTAFIPPPDPALIPPDPTYIKKWGAMVAFFERAFEWENIMFTYYPYFWGRTARWGELILIQDISPEFEKFLKAGAARVVVPARPGFEAALAHYQETGDIWMGEEIPDMFGDLYVSIIDEIKSRNYAPGEEKCVAEWEVKLPTTLVMLKEDAKLPEWKSQTECKPAGE